MASQTEERPKRSGDQIAVTAGQLVIVVPPPRRRRRG